MATTTGSEFRFPEIAIKELYCGSMGYGRKVTFGNPNSFSFPKRIPEDFTELCKGVIELMMPCILRGVAQEVEPTVVLKWDVMQLQLSRSQTG